MVTVTRRLISSIVVTLCLVPALAAAHGMSDIEATYELSPANAKPGESIRIAVLLKELVPEAADGVKVTARVTAGKTTDRIALADAGPLRYEGTFTLRSGAHDLRVFLEHPEKREVALAGFRAGERLQVPPESERELFFVPAGKYDANPWTDHTAGILVAVLVSSAIVFLLRRSRSSAGEANAGPPKPVGFLAIAAAGALAMAFGAYWDVSSHTTAAREGFFSRPHLVIYGGILLALLAVGASILKKAPGLSWKEHLRGDPAATVAGIAMLAQLGSGPFDELWHGLFGLDVGLWSPPHVVLIMGGVSVCLALSAIRAREGRGALTLRLFTLGGAMLTSEIFLSEYEFTMPSWHPSQARPEAVIVPGFLILFGALTALMAKRALPVKFGATAAIGVFLALRLLLYPYLALVTDGEAPSLSPWVLAPLAIAIAIDLTRSPSSVPGPLPAQTA